MNQNIVSNYAKLSIFLLFSSIVAAFCVWLDIVSFSADSLSSLFYFVCRGACDSSGCTDCCNSASNSASADSASSTPFLKVRTMQGEDVIVNDLMIGSPTSKFFSEQTGRKMFSDGVVGFDVFPFALPATVVERRALRFSLKEIEHETSYIQHLSYATVDLNKAGTVVAVDGTHQVVSLLEPSQIVSVQPVAKAIVERQLPAYLAPALVSDEAALTMQAGEEEYFTITATGPSVLVVGAYARLIDDRHLYKLAVKRFLEGEDVSVKTPFFSSLRRAATYTIAITLAALGIQGITTATYLDSAGFAPQAHASTPVKSLYFYYRDQSQQWREFGVIHPRFYLTHPTTITLPPEICTGEAVEIKVRSTMMHRIASLGVVSVDYCKPVTDVAFTPVSLRDVESDKVVLPDATSELVTAPGREYEIVLPDAMLENASHVLFKVHGFYVPSTPATKSETESWWSRLTATERALYTNGA